MCIKTVSESMQALCQSIASFQGDVSAVILGPPSAHEANEGPTKKPTRRLINSSHGTFLSSRIFIFNEIYTIRGRRLDLQSALVSVVDERINLTVTEVMIQLCA